MRFMMFMIPAIYQGGKENPVAADFTPPADAIEKMMKYNEELAKAGALISLDGLHPREKGARVAFSKGKTTITDGPFIESKELVGGYWLVQFKSKAEAIEWVKRAPAADGDVIEIRQVFELEDFPADVRHHYNEDYHSHKVLESEGFPANAQKAAENPTVKAQVGNHKHS